ncbi:DNA polymerase IV [Candidatus Gottesmanbacteria bacterium]|nr:DNA polymerase IV [Candidatus Gottesmanbacteria bacterium]
MRIIAHIDMDAFFAAIEERENPQYKGLGIVVGADPKGGSGRGVVSTANYQARKYGIHSAMPISIAWRLSEEARKRGEPKTVFLPVNGKYYGEVSERIFAIIRKYVPLVEQTSVDEGYLDLTFAGSFEKAIEIINKLKEEIREKERLTAKIAIAPNKLVAKIVTSRAKPDSVSIIYPHFVHNFLDPLAVGDIPGIGPKTEEVLEKKGIRNVVELRGVAREQLIEWFGKWGEGMYERARGIDESEVMVEREIKSISEQETFEVDTLSSAILLPKLEWLAQKVGVRMKSEGIRQFKTVTITVRFSDFTTKSRAHSLKEFTNDTDVIKKEAMKLFMPFLDKRENPQKKLIRLLGVGIEGFYNEKKKEVVSKQLDMLS